MLRRYATVLLLALPIPAMGQAAPIQYVFPLFVDGTSNGTLYRSTVKIVEADPATPSNRCTLTQRQTDAGFDGVNGDSYTADIFDSGDNPPAITQIILDRFLPWEVLRSNARSRLAAGYATLSCSAAVQPELQVTLRDSKGAKLGETTVSPATLGNSFQFILDTRDGTHLGFALANDSDVDGQYTVVARDQLNNLLDIEFDTLNAHSQVSRFIDEMLALPTGFVGSIEVIGVTGGRNYAVGLQFTGPVFAAVQPVVRASPLRF